MESNENLPLNPISEFSLEDTPSEIDFAPVPDSIDAQPADPSPVDEVPVETASADNSEEIPYEVPGMSLPEKKKSGGKLLKACIAAVFVIAMIATGCGVTAYMVTQHYTQQNNQLVRAINMLNQQLLILKQEVKDNSYTGNGNSVSGTPVPSEGLTPGQVYAKNRNSVVAIANQGVTTNIFGQTTQTASSGSGFVISEDGYIVTNYHVIKGATTLTVITNNEDEYPATVVGYDEQNDFALIKVDVSGWTPVTLGSSDDLIVGDQVVAIGNPLGEITNSLTVGYISVKDRDVTIQGSIINMLQTDAAINPGNSGGPLFNMKGEVIGITTAKYADESVEGIGFAIPIDDVSDMITDLLEKGYISSPYLGVQVTTAADGVGVYVYSVEASSPAAKAGLQKGDVILAVGDYPTSELAAFDKVLRNFEPNDTTTLQVLRNRQVIDLTITFGSKYQPTN